MLIIGGGDDEGYGDANSEDPNKYIKQKIPQILTSKDSWNLSSHGFVSVFIIWLDFCFGMLPTFKSMGFCLNIF